VALFQSSLMLISSCWLGTRAFEAEMYFSLELQGESIFLVLLVYSKLFFSL
jgi:hypothetical protein